MKGAAIDFSIDVDEGVVRTYSNGKHVLSVRYLHNRLHYNHRVLRLVFDVGDHSSIGFALKELLVSLLKATELDKPLLFRATVPKGSALHLALLENGFLTTRHVYEPWLDLERVDSATVPSEAELISLDKASSRFGSETVLQLYREIYARCSRLDPATPDALSAKEWFEILFEDEDLSAELSTCMVVDGVLAGILTVYSTEDPRTYQLGPFGVSSALLKEHQTLTVSMVSFAATRLRGEPWLAKRLVAEIDSDDPWSLYTCADFPFGALDESVSLVLVPAWLASEAVDEAKPSATTITSLLDSIDGAFESAERGTTDYLAGRYVALEDL